MNLSLFLFLIGILGFILNRKNIILMIIAIEIMLLAVTLLVLISSFSFNDGIGQTFSIFIITIAGAESVIGLNILVAFYRLRGNILLKTNLFMYISILILPFLSSLLLYLLLLNSTQLLTKFIYKIKNMNRNLIFFYNVADLNRNINVRASPVRKERAIPLDPWTGGASERRCFK